MKILNSHNVTKRFRVLILLLLPVLCAAWQRPENAYLDSLLGELPKMKEDSNGVRLLNKIALEFRNINPEEGIRYAAMELKMAQKLGWRASEAQAYNISGVNYLNKGDYPEALEDFFKAQFIFEETKDTTNIGLVYGNIGGIYANLRDYHKAQQYCFKQLELAKLQNDSQQIAYAFYNIGNNYTGQAKLSEALNYYKMALQIATGLNNDLLIMTNTQNIGATYASLRQYNIALAYDFKILRMAESAGNKQYIAYSLGNIGEAYFFIARDSLAIQADSLVPALRAANLAGGIDYLKKSIAASYEAKLLDAIPEFSKYLSEAFLLQGDYKSALAAYKQYTEAKDSLFSIANNEKITNLETKRALDLKDKDIKIAKLEVDRKRNERVYYISGILLLLLIMGILFRSNKRQQQSNHVISTEKKRSDDLLLNMLPAEVAEELKKTGMAHARQFEQVTVIFTDFVNFTGMAEKLSPHELVQELHESFSAFDAIIEKNGLEKIKTIGDAYLAICGLPREDPLHAQKCVKAGLEILDFIEMRNKRERPLRVRIGINSGPVVAGIVGVKKFAYDIWGDTVNTAARMEQHGEAGHINISHSTYMLVKDQFSCRYRGMIAAKNKGEVEMYFVNTGAGNEPMPQN